MVPRSRQGIPRAAERIAAALQHELDRLERQEGAKAAFRFYLRLLPFALQKLRRAKAHEDTLETVYLDLKCANTHMTIRAQ